MNVDASILDQRSKLADALATLAQSYWENAAVEDLVSGLTGTFDQLLSELWQQHFGHTDGCALFAVGGDQEHFLKYARLVAVADFGRIASA